MSIPIYLQVLLESTPLGEAKAAHKRIHDHLAGVLDSTVGAVHGDESARLIALVEAELSEEGKAIAMKHAVHLAKAHDESAKQSGMACEGAYNSALNIPDAPDADDVSNPDDPNGSDPNPGESAQSKGEKQLTEEEMIAALKAKGFAIETPKTPEQVLQEQFDAKLAAQKQEFDEKLKTLTESAPQRKTQALGSELEENALTPEAIYEDGDYLKGTLAPTNWKALANRRVPWPKDIDPELALHELAPFLSYRLAQESAAAQGRDVSDLIKSYENV